MFLLLLLALRSLPFVRTAATSTTAYVSYNYPGIGGSYRFPGETVSVDAVSAQAGYTEYVGRCSNCEVAPFTISIMDSRWHATWFTVDAYTPIGAYTPVTITISRLCALGTDRGTCQENALTGTTSSVSTAWSLTSYEIVKRTLTITGGAEKLPTITTTTSPRPHRTDTATTIVTKGQPPRLTSTPTSTPKPSATPSSPVNNSLSAGAKAGIGVGTAFGILSIATLLGAFVWRRLRSRKRKNAVMTEIENENEVEKNEHSQRPKHKSELEDTERYVVGELENWSRVELEQNESRAELSGSVQEPVELAGSDVPEMKVN